MPATISVVLPLSLVWFPTPVSCITIHPGFHNVCLDFWVLQTAFYFYHQQYGQIGYHGAIHEYVENKSLLYDIYIFFHF
jgi:hypothetical protein